MTPNTDKLAAQICRDVAELPDRNSPEDWPEAMLVTHEELRAIVLEALSAAGRVQQAEPVGEIYSHNCNSLGVVHAVVRFDGPFDPNDQHTWPAQGSKVYLAAPAERAPAPTVAEGRTDAEIEKLAIKHEAFGFGRVDSHGLTTHGFDPEGLRAFVRELLAAPTAQEASKPDGVKGYAMALNEVALQLRQRYAADLLSTPLWTEFEKRRNKFAQSISQPAQPSPEPSKPVQAEAASAHDWHHLDGRIKALMEQVGLPNSLSLRQAFSQLVNEMSVAATSKGTGNG